MARSGQRRPGPGIEWPTLAALAGCYALWAAATTWAAGWWLPLGVGLTAVAVALHSSLQHEALHGHPFRRSALNEALVFPALGLLVPYRRFRDTHLAHHDNAVLTDPYDDPESNYLDPAVWARLPRVVRMILRANNTLLGRMTLGPAVSLLAFLRADWRDWRAGRPGIARAWALHLAGVVPVLTWLATLGQMPAWAYALAVWGGLGLLKIRTFLEHQAHVHAGARSVIIEDRGPLALLFLNNNLHVVHHMHPRVPWYRLPALYSGNRTRYVQRNGGYVYRSYGQILARHLLRAKDPVPHPLMPQR